MPGSLHIIRMDVLLHALGGFEERRDRPRAKGEPYTDFQVREIKKLARQKLRRGSGGGEIIDAATRLDVPYRCLLTLVSQVRAGAAPKAWSHIA